MKDKNAGITRRLVKSKTDLRNEGEGGREMQRARQLRNAVVKLVGERCAIQKMQMEEMAGSKRNNDIENGVCYCEQSADD